MTGPLAGCKAGPKTRLAEITGILGVYSDSGHVLCAFGVAYAVTMVAGFAVMGNLSKPLEDPYLAIMEVLILVMAPVLVLLAVVIHARPIPPSRMTPCQVTSR